MILAPQELSRGPRGAQRKTKRAPKDIQRRAKRGPRDAEGNAKEPKGPSKASLLGGPRPQKSRQIRSVISQKQSSRSRLVRPRGAQKVHREPKRRPK